jgi:tetratricopeptide (TPR) repeat protein
MTGAAGLSVDRYKGFVFNPADLSEDGDLDADRRREILFTEARLATCTHFELLGLPWNAPAEAARAAYVEKVKLFHPDRYAAMRLGSYRARLEKVFRRLTEARDVLTDEPRRAAYARATAPALELAAMEARRLEDEKRSEERRARLARQNPLLARAGRVADLMKRGREAMAAGQPAQAANDFLLVAGLDPSNREAVELAAECKRRSTAAKVQELLDKAGSAEAMGQWGQALATYRAALEVDPAHLKACIMATRAAVELKDGTSAHQLADRAIQAAPRNGAAHEAKGLALELLGRKADAKKAYERALELDPRLDSAKERLKKLRWSFLG